MQKNIRNSAKAYGILLKYKVFGSLGSGFVIFEKQMFFLLGVAHGDLSFAQVGPKDSNFQRFQQNIFKTTGFKLNFLIAIEFPNILHWKPAKTNQIGCGLAAKFGPNYVQCCEKKKKTCNISRVGFFHILLGITF